MPLLDQNSKFSAQDLTNPQDSPNIIAGANPNSNFHQTALTSTWTYPELPQNMQPGGPQGYGNWTAGPSTLDLNGQGILGEATWGINPFDPEGAPYLGYESTLMQDSLPYVGVAWGAQTPEFGNSVYQDIENSTTLGVATWDLGPDSTLHNSDSILEQYEMFNPWSPQSNYTKDPSALDLNNSDSGQGYFHGINDPQSYQGLQQEEVDLHVHLLQNEYNYSHGTVAPWITAGLSGPGAQDLNSTFSTNTNNQFDLNSIGDALNYFGYVTPSQEPWQDPSNPIFDTPHEAYLNSTTVGVSPAGGTGTTPNPAYSGPYLNPLDIPPDPLHLQGQTGFFQGTSTTRDVAGRNSLNAVPGGITPSQYADLNNEDVSTIPPDGAPVPNSLLFHGVNDPSRFQGKQIGNVDLHEHLLDNSYSYNWRGSSEPNVIINSSATILGSSPHFQDLDIANIRNNSPKTYESRMSEMGDLGTL
jgi:hypothetical protein